FGTATTDLAPTGSVRIAGEQWSAVSESGATISNGERVMIIEVDGLTLKVAIDSTFFEQTEQ
ncbi:MAG: NfeD family protein, partial [Chloroflexi bacterium]|nr:NfeD family protein [Chloroflexota bacterium]